jgi:hypothetical protein
MINNVLAHYDALTCRELSLGIWMEEQARKNKGFFFSTHTLTPHNDRVIIDLGSGF